jgi:hypothetical protein
LQDFFTYRPLLPIGCTIHGELCKFYANTGGKQSIQRQLLLVQYKHQANPLLSMANYSPLGISKNDKNKQLTLLSQRKLALTAVNTFFCILKSSEPLKTENPDASLS